MDGDKERLIGHDDVIALRLPDRAQVVAASYFFQCAATTVIPSHFIPPGFFLDNPNSPRELEYQW